MAIRRGAWAGVLVCMFALVEGLESAIEVADCDASLGMDEALVRVIVLGEGEGSSSPAVIYGQNTQCYKCSYLPIGTKDTCAKVWSVHSYDVEARICNSTAENPCDSWSTIASTHDVVFGEHGTYNITLATTIGTDEYELHVDMVTKPANSLLALFGVIGVLVAATGAIFFAPRVFTRLTVVRQELSQPLLLEREEASSNVNPNPDSSPITNSSRNRSCKQRATRLMCLDAFRGASLLLMVFVNYGGGGYWFFKHADWNGLTFADLLFPWFMWIMGVSMHLSISWLRRKGCTRRDLMIKASIRSTILFALGIFLNNGYHLQTWRPCGVLQYFAVSYLLVMAIVVAAMNVTDKELKQIQTQPRPQVPDLTTSSTLEEDSQTTKTQRFATYLKDFWPYRYEWPGVVLLLIVYLLLAHGARRNGCPRGYVGPGGLAQDSAHATCTGGFHRTIDTWLFTERHLFQYPTCTLLYQCQSYDPEGVLGALTATVLTYTGLIAGRTLTHYKSHTARISRWLTAGACYLLLAGLQCGFSQNGGPVPVNKNLWSTSFVCVTAGFSLVILSVMYWLVDVLKWWSGAPFTYVGKNSILVYVGHEVLQGYFPFSYSTRDAHFNQLVKDTIGTCCWLVIATYLNHIEFFLKI